jgi:crotonobetainyl-CoA:carnitine CoA-transferase CaiB-like acyl-CoA transferase
MSKRALDGVRILDFTHVQSGPTCSITINTKKKSGVAVLDRLINSCDVLVENFAPGALDRMGITWEHVRELNPRMIVASVKGFGAGPYEMALGYGHLRGNAEYVNSCSHSARSACGGYFDWARTLDCEIGA